VAQPSVLWLLLNSRSLAISLPLSSFFLKASIPDILFVISVIAEAEQLFLFSAWEFLSGYVV
jgi:hypothetical protein